MKKQYRVNYKYFSRNFSNDFNIGFGSTATDFCGFCIRHHNQLALSEDQTKKNEIETNLKVQSKAVLQLNDENALKQHDVIF